MSVQLPADETELVRPGGLANGRPLGQRIRVPKTAELVAAELRRKIVRGELAEGDALPSEAALMADFSVSRPTLREAVAQAKQLMDDPQAFIRAHLEFHALLVELAGNQTMAVLNGMVRHIIDLANWSHVDLDAGSPENVRANKRGFRAHVRLVELVAAGQAVEAEALWRLHLQEAENYLLMNKSTTTVLDLLG